MASTETFPTYAPARERSIGELLGILRDGLLPALVVGVVVVALAVFATLRQPAAYSARGQVVLSNSIGFLSPHNVDALPLLSSNIIEISRSVDLLQDVSTRYAALAHDPRIRASRSQVATVDWLRAHVNVLPVGDTSLLDVIGKAPSQTEARDLSRATVEAIVATVRKYRGSLTSQQQQASDLPQGVSLAVFALGEELGKTSPTPVRNLTLGLMAALILSTATAATTGTRRRRLHDPLAIAESAEMQLFAVIDHVRGVREALIDPGLGETRARLQTIASDDRCQVVVVTGLVPAETIAIVSTALVRALAVTNEPTVLVDGDLATRAASTATGLDDMPGLADLGADDDPSAFVRVATSDGPQIDILPAGSPTSAAVTLLSKGPLEHVLGQLEENRRYIVVAGPPVDRLAAAIPLFAVADIALVLAPRGIPARKLEVLRRLGPELAGRVAGTIVVGTA